MPARSEATRRAQGVVVDQGSFTITVAGAGGGRETFAIRRLPGGYQASGTVLYPDRRLSPSLTTDTVGVPLTYGLDVRNGAVRVERVSVTRDRGFLRLRAQLPERESMRELPASPPRAGTDSGLVGGTVIVDDDIAHQYYFLMLGRREGVVSVVVPQRRALIAMRVERQGPDSVRIGGREVRAVLVRVTSDGDPDRLVWLDAAGRVLQLAIAERHLIATRDGLP
jgi:hypothetical protein